MNSIEYANTIDDLVAFYEFHAATSRVYQKAVRRNAIVAGVLGFVVIWSLALAGKETQITAVVSGLVAATILSFFHQRFAIKSGAAYVRKLYSEGRNKGIVGWHRLVLLETTLREESESGLSEVRFGELEAVKESPTHLFIYVSNLNAHVVPKDRLSKGDITEFKKSLSARVAVPTG